MSDIAPESQAAHRQAAERRRNRWATPAAALATGAHLLSILAVCGWYYIIAPRWKRQFEDFDTELSADVMFVVTLSDAFVNYWYLTVPLIVAFAGMDFLITRWLIARIGLRWTVLCVVGIAVLIVVQAIAGEAVLRDALLGGLMELSQKTGATRPGS